MNYYYHFDFFRGEEKLTCNSICFIFTGIIQKMANFLVFLDFCELEEKSCGNYNYDKEKIPRKRGCHDAEKKLVKKPACVSFLLAT